MPEPPGGSFCMNFQNKHIVAFYHHDVNFFKRTVHGLSWALRWKLFPHSPPGAGGKCPRGNRCTLGRLSSGDPQTPLNYRQIMEGPDTSGFLPQSWRAAPGSQRDPRSSPLSQGGHHNSGEVCDSREPRFLLCLFSVILCGGAMTTLARTRDAPVGMS